MRRKRLNHYADIVCKMFVGWRMAGDLERLSESPDGTVKIDLLTGEAYHSAGGELDLYISKELRAWLQQQGAKDGVDISKIESGVLEVDINTGIVATNRKKVIMFTFECRSAIETDEAFYKGVLKDKRLWHTRIAT